MKEWGAGVRLSSLLETQRLGLLVSVPVKINALVAEVAVLDWRKSLEFYTECLGFEVAFTRPDEGFVFLEFEGAQIMFYQANLGRNLVPEDALLERPLGRGVNLQIQAKAIAPLLKKLEASNVPLALAFEEKWYRVRDVEIGVLQFAVTDPDGYFLRFSEQIGTRAIS